MPIDATWTIGARDRTKKALTSAGKGVDGFGAKFTSFGKTAGLAMGGAALAIGGFAVKAIGEFTKTGDQVDKMSKRLGLSAESVQRLGFAAEQSGADLDTVERAFRRMAGTVLDANNGLSGAQMSLDQLGVSAADLEGLAPDEQFARLADALNDVEDASTRAALAEDVFGRAGQRLLPLIAEGSEGIKALGDEAERTGNVMSQQAASDAAKLTDTMNTLRHTIGGVLAGAIAPLLPAVETMARFIGDELVPRFGELVGPITEIAVGLLPVLTVALNAAAIVLDTLVVPALTVLADILNTQVGQALTIATGAVLALNAAAAANPYALLAAAAVAAAALIITHWEPISGFFVGLWDNLTEFGRWIADTFTRHWQWIAAVALGPVGVAIKLLIDNWDSIWDTMRRLGAWLQTTFLGAWNTARNGIKGAVNGIIGIVESMANAVVTAINAVIGAWNSFDITIPPFKIPIPFAPDIEFGGATIGVPDLPTLPGVSIPRLATGGFVPRPTLAVVGDAPGGEYVIPARQMRRQAPAQPIDLNLTLELDGEVLGQYTLRRVNEGLRNGEISAAVEVA